MPPVPLPIHEPQRLLRLPSPGVLDTLPQKALDDITAMACAVCGVPMATVALVDKDREWFLSRQGLEPLQLARPVSFSAHAILEPAQVMVVPDTTQDGRFRENPLVTHAPAVRFYAAACIVMPDGLALGTVGVFDQVPRQLTVVQTEALRTLADLVLTLMEHETSRMREVECQRREAQARQEQLMAMSTSGLDVKAYINRDCVYQQVNDTYLSYWGCRREDVIGRSVRERVGAELFDHFLRPRLDMALSGQPVFFQHTMDYRGCGPRHMDVALLPVRNTQGAVIGLVMRSHDIQLIKEKEAEVGETVAKLENKSREQQRFIHILSHDLREPINSINNFSALLTEEYQTALPPEGQRYLGFVRQGGLRMASLLDDLLHYVELDHNTLEKRRVNVAVLAEQVREDLHAALQRTGGRLELEPLPEVWADESLLRVALQNLVANGLKFSRPGVPPVVTLTGSRADGFDLIHIRDNGIGIALEHQAGIFDIFKRLHPRQAYEGSGLGLSICRRIAELHGGSLSVSSQPGQGCRFTLHLPVPNRPT